MLEFNTEPYNDDYDEDNKFYRILYRPSFAVQARELTQMQTILQNQIARHGSAIFKQGAMVIPGQISIDTKVSYVKLVSTYGSVTTESFIQSTAGKTITGSSGLKAQIIKVVSATSTDPSTIYVRYLNSGGTTGVQKVFADSEVLTLDDGSATVQAISSSATGTGSLATIQRGVYYVNGFFVLCADPITGKEQVIVLDKYTNTPSYRVGLTVIESEVTPEADTTLLDNAQTSYNYAAPGAHRYHIDLILSKLPIDSTSDDNFIELLKTDVGQIVRIVNKTQYSELEKTLARRTFDESGNYSITPFNADIREARNNNRGAWTTTATAYIIGDVVSYNGNYYTAKNTATSGNSTPPTHTTLGQTVSDGSVSWEYTPVPVYNRGISTTASDNQFVVALDPGKAYVQGYELEKVATEYLYIDKCRDAEHIVQVTQAFQPATVGNYVLVNSVNSVPFVDTFPTVGLYTNFTTTGLATALPGVAPSGLQPGTITTTTSSATVTGTSTKFLTMHVAGSIIRKTDGTAIGTVLSIASDTSLTLTANAASVNTGISYISSRQIGTARIRFIEWDNGTIGTTAAQYKLGLFDIKMTTGYDFKRNVKSIYYDNSGGGAVVDFSADIFPVTTRLSGGATASASTTITGATTQFQTDLVVGDYISLGGSYINGVYTGGTYRRVIAIGGQQSITVDQATTVSNVTIDRISTTILEPQNETMIFKLPYYGIKSLTATDGTTNRTTYYAYQKFDSVSPTTDSTYSKLTLSTSAGVFAPYGKNNYIFIDNTTGLILEPADYNVGTTTAYFRFTGTTYVGRSFSVIATVIKTLSANTQKSKSINSATVTFTSQAAAQTTILSLGQADGFRVTSVMMDTGTFAAPSGTYSIDISDYYTFDNGQRATHYALASLSLKPSFTVPNAPVQVKFEYWTHSSGDYCSVSSYPADYYKKIGSYNTIPLRDAIDFRPRISTDGVTFDTGSNLVPKRGQEIQTDFSYYLGRIDKIAIDKTGNFFQIKGTPALQPVEPPDPIDAMVLYIANIEPYTFMTPTTSSSVNIKKIENKRYTMRDIGKLEQRINNIEYYTSLSLLEQQTESTQIVDSVTGLNRFKNGFMVDNFSGHRVGDTLNVDYYCSIDMENNILRPFFSMKNVNLLEKVSTDAARAAANYKITGNLITLPYTTTPLITQPYASRLENVNPFAIFTFLGQVNMNPGSDIWFETDRRPDIVQNQEGDFNTIATLAEKAGVLGSVWNSWQTQWSGTPVVTTSYSGSLAGEARARGLTGQSWSTNGGWGIEAGSYTFTETTAQVLNQTRSGINTKIVAKIDTQLVSDRVLSTAVIPYVRSRNVLIQTTGLKPNTKFNAFFDNIPVDSYCTPATKITYILYKADGTTVDQTTATAVFDSSSNVGANTTETTRLINGDSTICLNTGEVITGSTSAATAVVVGTENILNDAGAVITRNVYVVNIKGTFTAGENITGGITNIVGKGITVGTVKTAGSSVYTDVNGKVQLLFAIPNTDIVRFRTGQRAFTLSDASTSTDITFTSRGSGQYYAQGVLETKQATYMSTRNGILVQTQVDDSRTITQTTTRSASGAAYYDPLAQTFLVDSPGGAFLTSVDLFFATKDKNIPVHIEIREVVNGNPGKTILPYSVVVLNPEKVNISTNTVTLPDGTIVPSYDTPTTFTFESPVYLNDATEYALVIASDSNSYKAWIANMGDAIPGSSRMISEQPYAGVLFKSQNGSTWTANQDQDLKFTLNRAVFSTNTIGNVQFTNDVINKVVLGANPFETNTGSAKFKVFHTNHGLTSSSYVTLSNNDTTRIYGNTATGTITTTTGSPTVNGVSTLFGTEIGTTTTGQGAVLYTNETVPRYIGVVSSVTTSSNTVLTLVSNAAIAYSGGTFRIAAAVNGIPVTEIYGTKTVSTVVDNDSYIIASTTTGKKTGYGGGTTVTGIGNLQYNAVQPQAQYQDFADTTATFFMQTTSGESINDTSGTQTPYVLDTTSNGTGYVGVAINDTNYFSTPRLIASAANQALMSTVGKSVFLSCKISTTNDAVSPVIDSTRMGLIAVSNVINAPTETNQNNGDLANITLLSGNTNIAFTSTGISSTNAAAMALLATLQVGKYITITGSGTAANNVTAALITAVASDGSSVTITNTSGFTVVAAGTAITVVYRNTFINEISPSGSSTHSKYVTKKVSLVTPATTIKIRLSVNSPTYSGLDVYYKVSPVGTKNAYSSINYTLIQPDGLFPKVQYGDNTYTDVDYTLTNMTPYDAFTVKLVFTSTNSSEVTYVKDLRIIAAS